MKHISSRLGCFGYHGFGTGWGVQDNRAHCNDCPRRDACWDRHRERVAEMFPELTEYFLGICKGRSGPEAVKKFVEDTELTADPYTLVLGANIQDAAAIRAGLEPKDRGDRTLSWPLVSLEVV